VVESGWGPISTLDLFGDGMVVLTSSEHWRTTAMACGKALGVPLAAYVIDGDGGLSDPSLRWADVFGVGNVGAVLVRPDGIVAWRTTAAADVSAKDFRRAMNRLLARRIGDVVHQVVKDARVTVRRSGVSAPCLATGAGSPGQVRAARRDRYPAACRNASAPRS
jgi:hypothetical protein